MRGQEVSQTALKVAYGLVVLSAEDDRSRRLPDGLAETTERVLLESGARGFGPRLMRAARKRWMRRVHEVQDRFMPGQFEGFGYRKIFMQHVVDEALAAGTRRVLVVAGGFDTLCLRLAPRSPDVRFFEVDHPGTSAAKAKSATALGWPPNMTLLAADLGERPLSTVMAANEDWDVTQPSVVVVEGLLQYLSDDDAVSLVSEVAACVPSGSRLAVSHMIPNDLKVLRGVLRLTGEPFLSSVASEDFARYIEGTGWTVTSGVDDDSTHGIERYAVVERN